MNPHCSIAVIRMRARAVFMISLVVVAAASALILSPPGIAQTQRVAVAPARGKRTISLRDRLLVGLQARLKSEVEFVDAVVDNVETGKLPQRLVDQTFFWARDRASASRNGSQRRPIIFFQPAMRARAKRLNVVL